ncbi:vWA domain-containing protein [uncultured Brachyspira sp.]|uniref:vWA domain-containing protein n=1 Tax=uncultured Brachyspira sp. TaxID=221953 RepID=UPI0026078247|nr:vWA domain-containing protein [uncultured Brachyspira sp.]
MRNLRYKYLFVILSVVFITTLENLYCQNTINSYAIRVRENDFIISQLMNGYQIYIKKKPTVSGFRLLAKLPNGNVSYLYIDESGNRNSIISINNIDFHNSLGEVVQTFIPETVYLDNMNNNASFTLLDNSVLILEAYDSNNTKLLDSEITLKINNNQTSIPTISLRNVEKEGDLYAFYLYYSGGDNGKYAFYVREGKTNTAYKLINTSFGSSQNYDGSGIVLEDTFNRELGKKLYIKAYFKQLPEDRYLSFNVFNTKGESFTYPIDYVIETTNIKKEITPPQMPSGGNEGAVPTRPVDKVIEPSTNTLIVSENNTSNNDNDTVVLTSPAEPESNEVVAIADNLLDNDKNEQEEKGFFNGEAIDALNDASKAFKTPNNYVQSKDELTDRFKDIIDRYKNSAAIDLVIVLDTTESMHPYLKTIKRDIRGVARTLFDEHKESRIGFLLYRDVKDKYLTKRIDFTDNINVINREVNYFYAAGGGDKAEPMYEAIQEALERFHYINEKKLVIVVTDAPAKIIGRADLELNAATAKARDITVELILTSELEEENENDLSDDYLYYFTF